MLSNPISLHHTNKVFVRKDMKEMLESQENGQETAHKPVRKSLLEMYKEARATPHNFIKEAAEVAGRTEWTVKMWLIGYNMPNDEVKAKLGAHFGVDPGGLFPDVKPYKRK